MLKMRPSVVLKKLRRGEIVTCFKTNVGSPRIVEIVGMCGFDCVWLDSEHTVSDWAPMEAQILAAKAHNMDTLVRISRGSYSDYIKPLELDASGIMVPHLMSAADARFVARTTRFHPMGRRPVDGGNADGAYCMLNFVEYLKQANRERFVIVQIEDPEPLDELDAIAATEGIDMLFFGPGDFSHGIGAPGQWDHPRIGEARKRIAETALRHGKFAGTVGGLNGAKELVDMGYRFLSLGGDVVGLSQYAANLLTVCRKATAGIKNLKPVKPRRNG